MRNRDGGDACRRSGGREPAVPHPTPTLGVAVRTLGQHATTLGVTRGSFPTPATTLGVTCGSFPTPATSLGGTRRSFPTPATTLGVTCGSFPTPATTLGGTRGNFPTLATSLGGTARSLLRHAPTMGAGMRRVLQVANTLILRLLRHSSPKWIVVSLPWLTVAEGRCLPAMLRIAMQAGAPLTVVFQTTANHCKPSSTTVNVLSAPHRHELG